MENNTGPQNYCEGTPQSKEQSEGFDQLKRDFISKISHDLRTPLAVIKESILLVADETAGPLNEKQKRMLQLANENIERLTNIVVNLLDVSKLGSKHNPARKE